MVSLAYYSCFVCEEICIDRSYCRLGWKHSSRTETDLEASTWSHWEYDETKGLHKLWTASMGSHWHHFGEQTEQCWKYEWQWKPSNAYLIYIC